MPLLKTFPFGSERIFELMKCFTNDLYDCNYTGGQAENNEEESGNDKEIDIKLKERAKQQMKITRMLLK